MSKIKRGNRIFFLDTLKGLLIIFVVNGHSPTVGLFTESLITLIYCFHIPAFFVLSSLNIKPSLIDELKGIKQIVIIYLFWLFYSVLNNNSSLPNVLFYSNWHHLKNVLWFLPALITFKLHLSALTNNYIKWISLVLGVLTIINSDSVASYVEIIPWGIHIAFYMTPCILIIRALSRELDFISRFSSVKATIILSIFFIVLLGIFITIESHVTRPYRNHFLDLAQFVVPSVFGYICLVLMMLTLVAFTKISIKKNLLSYVGLNSMPIYLFHFFFISQISKYMSINNHIDWVMLITLTVAMCLLLSFLLKKASTNFKYLGF